MMRVTAVAAVVMLGAGFQQEVQVRGRLVATAGGDVDWYFWGADTRIVTYGGRWGGTGHIVSVEAASGKATELYTGATWTSGALSRDGKRLVVLGRLWNGDDVVADTDVGKPEFDEGYHSETLQSPVIFSPDGKKMAYPGQDPHKSWICVEDVATGEVKRIAENRGRISSLSWSPDGKWFTYGFTIEEQREVWMAAADGSSFRNLTVHQAQDFSPTWAPDSKRVAFISDRDKGYDVYVIAVENRVVRRVTADGARKADVAWSPKDGVIVARTFRDMKWTFIFTTPGGDKVRIARMESRPHGPPVWSPKGDSILYLSVQDTGANVLMACQPPN